MGTLNDLWHKHLVTDLGETPVSDINSMLFKWFGDQGYVGDLNSRWLQFLADQGYTGDINTALFAYLGGLGYAGSIGDKIIASLSAGDLLITELIPNPDLDTDPVADGWTLDNLANWDEPNAQIDFPDTTDYTQQADTPSLLEDGVEYDLTYTISNYVGNGTTDRVRIYAGNGAAYNHNANGTFNQNFTAVVTTQDFIRLTHNGATSYSLDYISLKKA